MNNTKLIFYEHKELYEIFNEIKNNFDYELFYIKNQSELTNTVEKLNNYLIICKNIIPNEKNQISFENFPLSITTILNKINVEILKNNYSEKSKIEINKYRIDLNSKEMSLTGKKLKLTEKEVRIIIYLSQSVDSVSISKLQKDIWGYNNDLETHTVETHVHRLRKKINNTFGDEKFIISTKNGYKI